MSSIKESVNIATNVYGNKPAFTKLIFMIIGIGSLLLKIVTANS